MYIEDSKESRKKTHNTLELTSDLNNVARYNINTQKINCIFIYWNKQVEIKIEKHVYSLSKENEISSYKHNKNVQDLYAES